MGVMSALLQGGYVRRAMSKVGETTMARRGMSACAVALALLAAIPLFTARGSLSAAIRCLQAAAVCMSFTSATVVNSLTAAASLQCDEPMDENGKLKDVHPQLAKGTALGGFRSSGQLGRAIGPLIGAYGSSSMTTCPLMCLGSLRILLDLGTIHHLYVRGGPHVCAHRAHASSPRRGQAESCMKSIDRQRRILILLFRLSSR
jgi:hypothetical protein